VNKDLKNKLLLITYSVVLFMLMLNYQWLGSVLGAFGNVMMPFFIGGVIAFILNVIINMLEDGILKKLKKGKRALSIIMSLVIVFGFVVVLLFI